MPKGKSWGVIFTQIALNSFVKHPKGKRLVNFILFRLELEEDL